MPLSSYLHTVTDIIYEKARAVKSKKPGVQINVWTPNGNIKVNKKPSYHLNGCCRSFAGTKFKSLHVKIIIIHISVLQIGEVLESTPKPAR